MIKCYNKGVYAQKATTRATSDKIVARTASHARVKIWGVHTGSVRAYDKYVWHHIHWNMASYLLEYDIYWDIVSYILEYGIIFIGI